MKQHNLFELTPTGPIPANSTVQPKDAARLSKQCQLILDRLRQGPATNHHLALIALKYTGRISEIRKVGHDIRNYRSDPGGIEWYGLFMGGSMVA